MSERMKPEDRLHGVTPVALRQHQPQGGGRLSGWKWRGQAVGRYGDAGQNAWQFRRWSQAVFPENPQGNPVFRSGFFFRGQWSGTDTNVHFRSKRTFKMNARKAVLADNPELSLHVLQLRFD